MRVSIQERECSQEDRMGTRRARRVTAWQEQVRFAVPRLRCAVRRMYPDISTEW